MFVAAAWSSWLYFSFEQEYFDDQRFYAIGAIVMNLGYIVLLVDSIVAFLYTIYLYRKNDRFKFNVFF